MISTIQALTAWRVFFLRGGEGFSGHPSSSYWSISWSIDQIDGISAFMGPSWKKHLSLRKCHFLCLRTEPGSRSGSSWIQWIVPLKALLPRVQCHFEPGGAGALMAVGKIFLGTILDQIYLGCQSHWQCDTLAGVMVKSWVVTVIFSTQILRKFLWFRP
jgi:hypothetical protein